MSACVNWCSKCCHRISAHCRSLKAQGYFSCKWCKAWEIDWPFAVSWLNALYIGACVLDLFTVFITWLNEAWHIWVYLCFFTLVFVTLFTIIFWLTNLVSCGQQRHPIGRFYIAWFMVAAIAHLICALIAGLAIHNTKRKTISYRVAMSSLVFMCIDLGLYIVIFVYALRKRMSGDKDGNVVESVKSVVLGAKQKAAEVVDGAKDKMEEVEEVIVPPNDVPEAVQEASVD